jgi:hypothetical protein
MSDVKTCGTCRLWAPNFHANMHASCRGTTCCADAVMDLPASFIPNRQTMRAEEGEGCICWESTETPAASDITESDIPF